ncbi:MAG TPA: adenylate/guanylate cyclase domain-containing protein [Gaiellaceae bacterium]|nr:adenylate/guanylate cyclase domain-containing protein [Gaiellaceae bacterium]
MTEPALPGGTVTFLFSDIEGSTRLLEQLGDAYADVHREHRRILRDRLSEAGGQEVDTQGDAFFFSFARAKDAVVGAVAAQRELGAHAWPEGVDVKVRMGLHTGEPTVGDEGYLGMDVVRAARICSAGHGGQILLSETTRALVGNNIPEGLEIRDLGETNLKDVQHERIFQLALPEQRGSFPPLKTGAPAKTGADALAEEIERKVHQQILASFEPGSPDETTSKLAKLVLVGFLALFLALAALAAIVVLVRAVI